MQAVLWLSGAALFTLLSVLIQPGGAITTGLTVGIAGMVVSGIAFMLTEFVLRPISARALAGAPVASGPGAPGWLTGW